MEYSDRKKKRFFFTQRALSLFQEFFLLIFQNSKIPKSKKKSIFSYEGKKIVLTEALSQTRFVKKNFANFARNHLR